MYTCVEQSSIYCSYYGSFFARVYVHSQSLSILLITYVLASSEPLPRLTYRVGGFF